jgi:hypothetical protein
MVHSHLSEGIAQKFDSGQIAGAFAGRRRKKSPVSRAFLPHIQNDQSIALMATAWSPLGPAVTSKETFWPSLRDLNPSPLMDEKWAKRSLLPSSGVIKPKPLASLNHLTVPVAMYLFFLKKLIGQNAR